MHIDPYMLLFKLELRHLGLLNHVSVWSISFLTVFVTPVTTKYLQYHLQELPRRFFPGKTGKESSSQVRSGKGLAGGKIILAGGKLRASKPLKP